MTTKHRLTLLSLAAATVLAAFLIVGFGGGDDSEEAPIIDTRSEASDSTTTSTETAEEKPKPKPELDTTIVVRDGKSVEGVEKLRFRKGGDIRFTVRSDVADHVHQHAYDIKKDIEAGRSVIFDVPATIDGRFEVELEERAIEIARVEVVP